MPVESAADLASMFEEDEFAERAEYTGPGGGAAIPCTVIVDRGQGRRPMEGGEHRPIATSERQLWAQRSELDTVERGGIFAMLDADGVATGEEYTVAEMPALDHTARLWSVELLIRD